jgi:glutamate dehydrogenase
MIDVHGRYIRALEHEHRLSRSLEALPNDKQLAERQSAGLGLTSPELAVLLSYAKIELVDAVLASDVADDPFVQPALAAYFPTALRERFAEFLPNHRLRRPITATVLVNEMVNRCGPTFAFRMADETGASPPDIMRAYLAATRVFAVEPRWRALIALDDAAAVTADVQLALMLGLRLMIERGVLWLLRHRRPPLDIAGTVQAFQPGVAILADAWPDVLSRGFASSMATASESAIAANVPPALAAGAAAWPTLATALDIIEVAAARGRTPADAARVYWGLFDRLDLGWLWERINGLPRGDRWQSHAQAAAGDDLLVELRTLADDALRAGDVFTPVAETIDRWMAANERALDQVQAVLGEIRAGGVFDLTTLSVALRQLRNLVMASRPTR